MKSATVKHRKSRRLARALNIEHAHAIGILAVLWEYAKREAKDGDLSDLQPEELAEELGWPAEKGETVYAALHDAGWLDAHPGAHPAAHGAQTGAQTGAHEVAHESAHAHVIHDWLDHCEGYIVRDLISAGRLPEGWKRSDGLPEGFYVRCHDGAVHSTTAQCTARHSTAPHCSPSPSPSHPFPTPSPRGGPTGDEPPEADAGDGFDEFWAAWPEHHRKTDKKRAHRTWTAQRCPTVRTEVMACLERWKASADWAKDDRAFIPMPSSWLNKRRWEDETAPPPAADADDMSFNGLPPPSDPTREQADELLGYTTP